MLLTLFLVQHHRPEERGVLPRAIRPRLQQAAPLGLLTASPGNGFETRGWLDYASIKQNPGKMNCRLHVFFPPSINNNSHTEYATYAARSPFPDWTETRINSDQTALVALDKFHANKKKRQNNEKQYKSSVAYVDLCTHGRNGRSDWTAELSSLLIFSPSRSHLLRNINYIQTNPIANLTTAKSKLAPPRSQFMCRARLCCCYWINARSFQRPSDSPVN